MNDATIGSWLARLAYQAILSVRHVGTSGVSATLGPAPQGCIQSIYVINLDREADRWRQTRREIARLSDSSGERLTEIVRRFSAVDARYRNELPTGDDLHPQYSLADQLSIEPLALQLENPHRIRIDMTRQESAVALSHIAVWRRIADGQHPYVLVLEDDVYFRRNFARVLDRAWRELEGSEHSPAFDLLYVSYKEARGGAAKEPVSDLFFRPLRGLWQLSGYVLSKRGAVRLLGLLPVRGPVDLWMNHQFKHLDVLATARPIIEQRLDYPSANSYSILPVLSGRGVLMREKPLLPKPSDLQTPVFGLGRQDTGLTALASALSMAGYRCCSDVSAMPQSERQRLLLGKRGRIFDAYVNVGSLRPQDYVLLAKTYPKAQFILTTNEDDLCDGEDETFGDSSGWDDVLPGRESLDAVTLAAFRELLKTGRVLILPAASRDKWELLRNFLGFDYPSHQYPECDDQGQRHVVTGASQERSTDPAIRHLRSDRSPWVAPRKDWRGVALAERADVPQRPAMRCEQFEDVDGERGVLRDDTFPSNLALFRPANFVPAESGVGLLQIRKEPTTVRRYTSASVCSRRSYLYGRFVAELKPAKVAGLVTGVFLHRNAPRQEIDMEFLGRDTSKLLVNVYYNPGYAGAKMEYGYRGTPDLVDLGFDAADDFHRYEIEWGAAGIRWRVDGHIVCERANWDPTPIPHLQMQFHVNLWASRSRDLVGHLSEDQLPASSELRRIEICA